MKTQKLESLLLLEGLVPQPLLAKKLSCKYDQNKGKMRERRSKEMEDFV